VRVMATGVNPVDWKKLNSKPAGTAVAEGLLIPGWDGAGIVVKVGEAAAGNWRVGDCVMWMGSAERSGTYAE
jgi:NADPH2:quinone reductase